MLDIHVQPRIFDVELLAELAEPMVDVPQGDSLVVRQGSSSFTLQKSVDFLVFQSIPYASG